MLTAYKWEFFLVLKTLMCLLILAETKLHKVWIRGWIEDGDCELEESRAIRRICFYVPGSRIDFCLHRGFRLVTCTSHPAHGFIDILLRHEVHAFFPHR
jgi:hypothetical protein